MADKQPTAGDAAAVDAAAAAVSKLHLDEVTGEMISKTELKKRQKAREKDAAKKEKDAAKDKKPAQAAGNKNAEAAEKELTPNQVCVFSVLFCRATNGIATFLGHTGFFF
jgi:lysyl-tRNA synthetase class 2